VKIERDHNLYLSKIHMRLPGMVLHAQKKGQTVWEALNLSYEAIVKQVVKFKMKKRTKKKHIAWRWQKPHWPPPEGGHEFTQDETNKRACPILNHHTH